MAETDFILTGARVYTGVASAPFAEAIAVADGRIVAVGNADEVAGIAGPGTDIRNLDGAFVMPGLIDVHNHHALAGKAELFELTFSAGATLDEVIAAVAAYARTLPDGGWITGGSWGSTLLDAVNTDEALARLDRAAGGRPVMLADDSHHNRWVSSRALELAGIDEDSDPGEGGVILLDPNSGRATGVLLESAGIIVERVVAKTNALTADQHRLASRRGIEILSRFGITAFQDAAASLEILASLASLDSAGELDAWVVSSILVNDQIFGFDPVGQPLIERAEEFRTEHHRPDFVKIFLDGVPPARTGAFLDPYLPDETHGAHFCGATAMDPAELYEWLRSTAERGLSAKIHCTGDASARLVLDTVQRLRAEGHEDVRYQIAHGQFLADSDLARFAELGVSADISPFIWTPGVIPQAIASVLPADRAERMQPNRALLDLGALVAAGSDWPVCESPNPWEGIQGLVTRADPRAEHPGTLWAEQAITLEEAIAAFTINGATAMGLGEETGTIEVGKSADLVVLDRDPFSTPVEELIQTRATETWFAGRRVFAS